MSTVDNIASLQEQLSPSAYLGMGLAWPPREDPTTGDFKKSDAEESISDCLLHLISTSLGEITPLQDFGTRIDELLFAVGAESFVQAVATSIQDAVEVHERRVRLLNVTPQIGTAPHGTKTVTISIRYRIIATGRIKSITTQPPGQGNS